MRYITKCDKRLTTPLKVWRHWRLTTQQGIARCSWLVKLRTGLRGPCQAAIKWRMAAMYASYSLRMEEAIKESVVRESTETRSQWARRRWRWWMNFLRSSAMSDAFIVLFTFLALFWLFFCKSDPRSHYLRVLALTCPLVISPRPLQIFVRALNNDVRLIARFYGSCVASVKSLHF